MAHQKVKNMGRKQQQAVFANMGDAGYLRRLESAEQYKRRTEYLNRKHELAEDVEDKLFDVWNSKTLTYRQKMAKATALKKDAKKKLESYQKAEFASTITGKIAATQEKRFAEKYGVSKIRKTNRASLDELEKGAKIEYERGDKKLMTMETARRMAANNLKKNPDYYNKNLTIAGQKGVLYKDEGLCIAGKSKAVPGEEITINKSTESWDKKYPYIVRSGDLRASFKTKEKAEKYAKEEMPYKYLPTTTSTGKAADIRKDTDKDGVPDHLDCEPKNPKKQDEQKYKVVTELPAVGWEKKQIVEGEPMTKDAAEKAAKQAKKLGYYAGVVKAEAKLKDTSIYKRKDTDKDGVPDHLDCEPKNPKKQGKVYELQKKSNIPKGWIKTKGTTTAPEGYYWASNGKSRFSGERKIALIKEKKYGANWAKRTLEKQRVKRFKAAKKTEEKRKIYTPNRQKLYKDAYSTREEADDIADYLAKTEHKKDVYVFKDVEGDWNIAYNE